MSRPIEPQKKQKLLEGCLGDAIEVGVLDSSINAFAKIIGTSGRMLVYHFGSKQELEKQLISLLEIRLREQLWSFHSLSGNKTNGLVETLLEMWKHLTSPEMHGLLKLAMEVNQRSIQGDLETQIFVDNETQQWIDSLYNLTNDKTVALLFFHVFQGALLDFFPTGEEQRGKQSIEVFAQSIGTVY
ncbi:MAG: TetR/AcrR family transcriptional regulator [Richelia sp.]|nr:TetR/AcrR family transcriptional regulator [Richelia sp.]